jgi:hypothetical protein
MGCWNGTCGLSGLPITHGDEMYVFPIVGGHGDSFCYASALYRPVVLPFLAEYNDYGGGEKCSGVGLEINMLDIKNKLVEMEVGDNKYHDIAVKREGFDADSFFDACHRRRLKFVNPMKHYPDRAQENNVFFTMVRKDVVDRLWNDWTFDQWKGTGGEVPEGFESDQYYVKNVTYKKLATLIPDFLDHCANSNDPLKDKLEESFNEFATVIDDDDAAKAQLAKDKMDDFLIKHNFFEGDRDHLLSGGFGHAFGSGYAGGGFSSITGLNDTIIDAYLSGEKEVAHALMNESLIGIMVNSFMESTRKVWLPSMHQGSQSQEYDDYLLMNTITNDIIAADRIHYEDDYDDGE